MLGRFFLALREQLLLAAEVIRTREFWIYFTVLAALAILGGAMVYMAAGFDPLTRGWLSMGFSCRTGEGQLATIIIGTLVFCLACMFSLGEVVYWVEENRMARAPGREPSDASPWRPILAIAGTMALGITGFVMMRMWCS